MPYMTIDNGTVLFVDPAVPNLEIHITCLLIKGMSGLLGVYYQLGSHKLRGLLINNA